MKRILLTRSASENRKIKPELQGFKAISCPVLSYENLPIKWGEFSNYNNLIITSKYAAILIAENFPFEANIYVVGEESAKILSQNPKLKIAYIADNASNIEEKIDDRSGFIYLSGNHITRPFEGIERKEIYRIEYTDSIDENIFKEEIDYVFLYSKNCAMNFIKLLSRYNLLQNIRNSVVIALSKGVAEKIEDYVFEVLYPNRPIANDMVKLLYEREKQN